MRNKKLFILVSLILVFSLIFVGCGKKSVSHDAKNKKEKIVVEDKKVEDKPDKSEEDKEDILEKKDETQTDKENHESKTEENKDQSVSSTKENKNAGNTAKKSTSSSNNSSKNTQSKPSENKKSIVTITIVGPKDVGTILGPTKVEIDAGDTVFDVLKKVTRDKKIQMEFKGRKSNVYIQGINNIYEFDKGPESGWIYRVNGEVPQVSCGGYSVKNCDNIEWLYTTDLGREFGAKANVQGGGN